MRKPDKVGTLAIATMMMLMSGMSVASEKFITVASTTSTQNSGLYDALLPAFTRQSGIEVRVVAVGTGKAIKMAEAGDADVLLVHHRASEEKFVAEGFGVERFDVMYNDFVLIGPEDDPAGIRKADGVLQALQQIAASNISFVSRSDDSGTHKKERSLWAEAGLTDSELSADWYRETGSGMGATLNVAAGMGAYAMSDRSTWIKFGNKAGLALLFEGEPRLFNQYGVILVNPERHKHIKSAEGKIFIEWLLSVEGQAAINAYQINGQQGFFANAG